ncbi:MAG: hypothetical protein ABUR63_06950, partial [Verrucomicrobiota bacterium]
VKIALRLGIDEEDIHRAEFLVRQHLVMGQMSQRRDLDDLEMIANFATLCGDEENLRELYLLTFCDLSSVAPDNLTTWKETLLRELYQRTLTVLRRGGDLLGAERAEIAQRRQERAARLLADDRGGAFIPPAVLFQGFPDRYFVDNSAARVAGHMRLLAQRRKSGAASTIEVSHQKRVEVSELVLAAIDQPGLLAEVAGVLHANKINIVDAAIYSRVSTPDQPGEALDIFRVRDSYGRLVTDEARWNKIGADLEAVISGKVKVESLVAARPRGDSITMWKVPEVPTEIKIDNDGSRAFTIVEVITGDYPGILYEIARTMFAHGLDIHRSKIATEANRVVDTFYVRGRKSGEKLTDATAISALRDALRESLPTTTK